MEGQDDPLLQFLEDRGIDQEILDKLKNDKIDSSVITFMSEKDLSKYIPHYGDRLAAVAFCRRQSQSAAGTSTQGLLQRIRAKCSSPDRPTKAKKRHLSWEKLKGNKNAKKTLRRIELGWINFCENENAFKQVRTKRGGGTRHVCVDSFAAIRDIQEEAETLFFPNGSCKSLQLTDCVRYMCDFAQNEVDPECSIQDLYEKNKVRILRLYLCTKRTASRQQSHEVVHQEQENVDNQNNNQDNQDEGQRRDIEQERPDQETTVSLGAIDPIYVDFEVIVQAQDTLTDPFVLEDTLPWEDPKLVIVVRRGHCLSDLMTAFLDPEVMNKDIHVKRKLPNGELEEGEGSGVLRDCLTEFWGDFYSKCTLGTNVKTPYIRHEYQTEEWQAIARILVTGWTSVRYFPLLLPLPFLEEALYGTTYSSVTQSFLQYVSKEERGVLEQALKSFQSVDKDDLLDVLDVHDCHHLATEQNIAVLLSQLGHKTIIQTPMFVIKCWRPILKVLADTLCPQRLAEIIDMHNPTPKRVKDLLILPREMTAVQNSAARNLKRYIGECDDPTLRSFLRFCTGADVLCGHKIKVEFIETSEFQCRPQAHTCGCHLMLPVNYQNYPDLRNDFDLILRSSVWVMDIV